MPTPSTRPPDRKADYHAARIGAAGAITLALFIVLVSDVLQPEYEPSPFVLLTMASLIAGLLAIDLPDILRRE